MLPQRGAGRRRKLESRHPRRSPKRKLPRKGVGPVEPGKGCRIGVWSRQFSCRGVTVVFQTEPLVAHLQGRKAVQANGRPEVCGMRSLMVLSLLGLSVAAGRCPGQERKPFTLERVVKAQPRGIDGPDNPPVSPQTKEE